MSDTTPITEAPILPDNQPEERPLFFIMAIMSYLTALTLLFGLMGFRVSQSWQQDLAGSMTIQLLEAADPLDPNPGPKIIEHIREVSPRHKASVVSEKDSRALLRPWIGDLELPGDLSLPVLIRLDALPQDKLTELQSKLEVSGFEVDIDDHSVWRKNIQRSWRGVQLGMLAIILIILTASISISSYATQSVLRARQNIIDVLSHVGAKDQFIAKLFVSRFGGLGLKAACVGSILALISVLVLGLFIGFTGSDLQKIVGPKLSDLIILGLLTAIMGIISGVTAGHITRSKLRTDRVSL